MLRRDGTVLSNSSQFCLTRSVGHMTAPRKIDRSSNQSLHKRSRPHMTAPATGVKESGVLVANLATVI